VTLVTRHSPANSYYLLVKSYELELIHFFKGRVMMENLEPGIAGVVCLHCGMDTPIPNSGGRGRSARIIATPRPPILLIRCTTCGKEAPYLGNQIVNLERVSVFASHAA
jgi:hypothetical protein